MKPLDQHATENSSYLEKGRTHFVFPSSCTRGSIVHANLPHKPWMTQKNEVKTQHCFNQKCLLNKDQNIPKILSILRGKNHQQANNKQTTESFVTEKKKFFSYFSSSLFSSDSFTFSTFMFWQLQLEGNLLPKDSHFRTEHKTWIFRRKTRVTQLM